MKKKKKLFINDVLTKEDKKLPLYLYHLSKKEMASKEIKKYGDSDTFGGKLDLHIFYKPMSKLFH